MCILPFSPKIWVHNIAFSSEKLLSESGEKSAQIKLCLQAKTVLNKYVCGFWWGIVMEYGLVNWWTGLEWITCGLLWCFYHLFGLSFWRHPFTAEDPLMSMWCNIKLNFSKSVPMKKQTHLYIGWLEVVSTVHFQEIFIFRWITPLN